MKTVFKGFRMGRWARLPYRWIAYIITMLAMTAAALPGQKGYLASDYVGTNIMTQTNANGINAALGITNIVNALSGGTNFVPINNGVANNLTVSSTFTLTNYVNNPYVIASGGGAPLYNSTYYWTGGLFNGAPAFTNSIGYEVLYVPGGSAHWVITQNGLIGYVTGTQIPYYVNNGTVLTTTPSFGSPASPGPSLQFFFTNISSGSSVITVDGNSTIQIGGNQNVNGNLTALSIYSPSISGSDIAASGTVNSGLYLLSGQPLNFSALTNSVPLVLFCTNAPGLSAPTNSSTNFFGIYQLNTSNGTWTNTANNYTIVPSGIYTNIPDQTAYGLPNAASVFFSGYFSMVTNFTRNFTVDISTNLNWALLPPTVTNIWFKGNSIYGNWNIYFPLEMGQIAYATNNFPYVSITSFTNNPVQKSDITNTVNAISGVIQTNGNPLTMQFSAAGTNAIGAIAANAPGVVNTNYSGVVSFTNGANNFVGSLVGNGLGVYGFIYNNAGYRVLYATNYGVQGVVLGVNASLAGLTAQDTALANFANALSNNAPASGILPSGVIKQTMPWDIYFSGFMLVGQGVLHQAWGNNNRFGLPWSGLWQSNTNLDSLHLNACAQGMIRLQDFEMMGGTNPVHNMLDAAYYQAPMYSTWASGVQVTNKNQLSKVGLTVRDTGPSGGIEANNICVDGFKIGIVNGGNDEYWKFVQMPECDLGFFNALSSANPGYWNNFHDCPINMGAYGTLIDTNLNGSNLGVPDQVLLQNVTFGFRRGGVGIYLERGNGFQIKTSCGIDGPRTYAILGSAALLDVDGGNDEPNSDIGTNWIYCMQQAQGAILKSWRVQGSWSGGNNVYGEPASNFVVMYGGDNSAGTLTTAGTSFFVNGLATKYWQSGNGGVLTSSHTDTPGYWESGITGQPKVYDWGNGDTLAPGVLQPLVGNGRAIDSVVVVQQAQAATGRFLTIKHSPWDFPAMILENGTAENTNLAISRPWMSDLETLSNFYNGGQIYTNNFTGAQNVQTTNIFALNAIFTNIVSPIVQSTFITNIPGAHLQIDADSTKEIHLNQNAIGGIIRLYSYTKLEGSGGTFDSGNVPIVNFAGGQDGGREMQFNGTFQTKIGFATKTAGTDDGGMTNSSSGGVWWGNFGGASNIQSKAIIYPISGSTGLPYRAGITNFANLAISASTAVVFSSPFSPGTIYSIAPGVLSPEATASMVNFSAQTTNGFTETIVGVSTGTFTNSYQAWPLQ